MTGPRQPAASQPFGRGLACLLLAQFLAAGGMLVIRQPADVPSLVCVEAVAAISCMVATAAGCGWWLSLASHRSAATSPALAVAGGLAASLIRLALPLTLLGWLQTGGAGDLLSIPLRQFLTETLVTSYLVLLLVDILLHITGSRQRHPEHPTRETG